MQLKPYFKKGGTVTAGNCCSVGSALVARCCVARAFAGHAARACAHLTCYTHSANLQLHLKRAYRALAHPATCHNLAASEHRLRGGGAADEPRRGGAARPAHPGHPALLCYGSSGAGHHGHRTPGGGGLVAIQAAGRMLLHQWAEQRSCAQHVRQTLFNVFCSCHTLCMLPPSLLRYPRRWSGPASPRMRWRCLS